MHMAESTASTNRMFFSYASEDAAVVDQVAARVQPLALDAHIFVDRYEILSGQSLYDRIEKGILSADRYFVFLSAVLVTKPWVTKELRAAMSLETEGRRDFVVPVLLSPPQEFPLLEGEEVHRCGREA
jgi:hypothetical protein